MLNMASGFLDYGLNSSFPFVDWSYYNCLTLFMCSDVHCVVCGWTSSNFICSEQELSGCYSQILGQWRHLFSQAVLGCFGIGGWWRSSERVHWHFGWLGEFLSMKDEYLESNVHPSPFLMKSLVHNILVT